MDLSDESGGGGQARPGLSLVIPCYNEEQVLPELFDRILAATLSWDMPWEVILVDDGSSDQTWETICQQHHADPKWSGIRFARNFGHQTAVSAGIWHASGNCVVVMDADLQDPPEVIGQFLKEWQNGYEVVYAIRRKRKEGVIKRGAYFVFYRILRGLADIDIPLDSGDFCLMDRKVVDVLKQMPERNRFVRGLRAWAGFRQIGVVYERQERAGGEPKYTFRKLGHLALDGLLSFSVAPLRMAAYTGFLISSLAFVGAVFTLLQRIFAAQFARIGLEPVPGFATIVISVLFLGGVQLIFLGIIGEYLGRMYDEIKCRPQWLIREKVGLTDG